MRDCPTDRHQPTPRRGRGDHQDGENDHQRRAHFEQVLHHVHRGALFYCRCRTRSIGLMTSVRRTPSFSFTTTASPRATNFPFTCTSTGSPANLSNSTTDPCPSWSKSRMSILVEPIRTESSS